jgi:spermidine synthase
MNLMFTQLQKICQSTGDRRVLLLGIGGGELAQHLVTHCPNVHVVAVELDGQVIELAQRYLGLNAGPRLEIKQGNALDETRKLASSGLAQDQLFDTVVVDCFGENGHVPVDCRSRDFLKTVHQVLKPGGTALQGIWHYSPDEESVAHEFTKTTQAYSKEFGSRPAILAVDLPVEIMWADVLMVQRPEPYNMGLTKPFGNISKLP